MPSRAARALLLCGAAWLYGPAQAADDDALSIERLYRGGETALAAQRMERALAARPGDARLRFLHGVMLSEQRQQAEAMAVFQRLTEDFPDLPEPYNNLAVLHAAQGRIDSARQLLETALRHDSGYTTAHENLGDVYVLLAQRAYERAGGSAPRAPALQRKLTLARELAAAAQP